MTHHTNLRNLYLLHPQGIFIPYYQRHYVWGVEGENGSDPAAFLTQCLLDAYLKDESYFLQGFTFAGDYLVDGQQRATYLYLLLCALGEKTIPALLYDNRGKAQQWLAAKEWDRGDTLDQESDTQDIALFRATLRSIFSDIDAAGVDKEKFRQYVLQRVEVLHISLDSSADEVVIYQMMNGTKAPMAAADVIKADIMRMASDPTQPNAYDWELLTLRHRYAGEWGAWVRWWHRPDVRQYFSTLGETGLDLLIKLCLRPVEADFDAPLGYHELGEYLRRNAAAPYHAAKHVFGIFRSVQRRIDDAYSRAETYNRIRAILLLQRRPQAMRFLHRYFVECSIDSEELLRYYKLSFLGMEADAIHAHEPAEEAFDDMLASLSMADVYHTDAKRDVFNLLLRLNIDEDIKLGRKFDFSVWENRSLEHVYSKSKVWHTDANGRVLDGNDNVLSQSISDLETDPSFMPRASIVNRDGMQLSEHCIGNLVLLYGQNNAEFGNATFAQKKMMFLAPGDMTVFRSRNLLHTVCVFASNAWTHQSIINNYNLTLKNLKVYYGVK